MKPHSWYCETWRQTFWFCFDCSHEQLSKWMKKKFGDPPNIGADRAGLTATRGVHTVIWVRKKSDLGTLVHECIHAANMALAQAGVVPSFENDEAQTYLAEMIFKKGIKK